MRRTTNATEDDDKEFAEAEDSSDESNEVEPIIECEVGLPARGLKNTTKRQLLDIFDDKGINLYECNHSNRHLQEICNEHPDKFGSERSEPPPSRNFRGRAPC